MGSSLFSGVWEGVLQHFVQRPQVDLEQLGLGVSQMALHRAAE